MGVAFRRVNDQQNHVGIAYRGRGSAPRLLHLFWHRDLREEDVSADYLYWVADVAALRIPSLTGFFRLLASPARRHQIPYGIAYPGDQCFDAVSGEWLLGEKGQGLTCATFVLAAFAHQGLQLVAMETWKERTTDQVWREQIAARVGEKDAKRADYLRKETKTVRYRPEEVAAATSHDAASLPVAFTSAIMASAAIVAEFDSQMARAQTRP